MVKKNIISGFKNLEGTETISALRFGGQPSWLSKPEWPWSESWNRPMQFICQVPLFLIDPSFQEKIAYLFVTHPRPEERGMFFDPDVIFHDGGENAVVVQPSGNSQVPTRPQSAGPTLYDRHGQTVQLEPILQSGDDPEFVDHQEFVGMPAPEQAAYYDSVQGSKFGGVPGFFQGDDWPGNNGWLQILQLDASQDSLPFFINLGASPVLFAFVSSDGSNGRMVVQDS